MSSSREPVPGHIQTPPILCIQDSLVDKNRIGVFSRELIKKDTEFGPFDGRIVYDKYDDTVDQKYSWQVFDLETFKFLHTVDATNPECGNWMRYVCCARYFEEQNIVSTQNEDQVYYKVLKDIPAGEELLTWFQAKKKKKRKSSSRLLDMSYPTEIERKPSSHDPSPPSPGKMKRKRKPKVIPDAYVGPFDFEEREREKMIERGEKKVKPSAKDDDAFAPLQPGQKRRRRKKTTDAPNSTSTSVASSPCREIATPIAENPSHEDVKPLVAVKAEPVPYAQGDSNMSADTNYGQKKATKSIAEINEEVDWKYPENGDDKADITNCLINLSQVKHHLQARGQDIKNLMTELKDDMVSKNADDSNHNDCTDIKDKSETEDQKKDIQNETIGIEDRSSEETSSRSNRSSISNISNENEGMSIKDDQLEKSQKMDDTGNNENEKKSESEDIVTKLQDLESISAKSDSSEIENGAYKNLPEDVSQVGEEKFPGLFRCYTCYRLFDTVAEIHDHLPQHSGEGDGSMFSCDQCHMHFAFKNNLVRHQRSHDGKRTSSIVGDSSFEEQGSRIGETEDSNLGDSNSQTSGESGQTANPEDKDQSKSTKPDTEGKTAPKEKRVYKCGDIDSEDSPHFETEISFANDEIDEGEGRFKFSCTVCKKRFSSYLNMCRHRRKVHTADNKPRNDHMTFGIHPRPPSPIVENPEETAAFYANVAHNIAINLNCYIDGTAESIQKYSDHIAVDDNKGHTEYAEKETLTEIDEKLKLDNYNFPSNFMPADTVSYTDIKNALHIYNDFDSHCTSVESRSSKSSENKERNTEKLAEQLLGKREKETNREHNFSDSDDEVGRLFIATENAKNVDTEKQKLKSDNRTALSRNCKDRSVSSLKSKLGGQPHITNSSSVESQLVLKQFQGNADDHHIAMGIASYGMKLLSNLVMAKRAPDVKNNEPQEKGSAGFLSLQISNGQVVTRDSPAARTFHQVRLGEYANFQDDLLNNVDDHSVASDRTTNKDIVPLAKYNVPETLQASTVGSVSLDKEKDLYAETTSNNRQAQEELDALYDDLDSQLSDDQLPRENNSETSVNLKNPKRLNQICERMLGVTPKSTKRRNREEPESPDKSCENMDLTWFHDQKPDYSRLTVDSPFYNYDQIEFGHNGEVSIICTVCKKHFKDLDLLIRHHWKKHPAVQLSFFEIEEGNDIEDLHYLEPSCVGALAVSDPGWDSVTEMESFKCSHCSAVFKSLDKLHVHIVSCSPIDPLYGMCKPEKSGTKTPLKKKIHRKIQSMFGNGQYARMRLDFDDLSSCSSPNSQTASNSSLKRVFTGSRKRISVLLPESPVQEPEATLPVVAEKLPEPVVTGYNPNKHVRRRELTELVDLLTCEGCGLKCKTIILLERHVRHCTRKEKFRTVKPLACPIIDDNVDRVKNMCFYCEKNFTYTKSLVNHFQDFCPVKKAKLDIEGVTEEDKEREAAILERIQKCEEEKIALKEKEIESNTKRRITWQVGRKPKRKGFAWTGRRKNSQNDLSSEPQEDVDESKKDDNDKTDETNGEKTEEKTELTEIKEECHGYTDSDKSQIGTREEKESMEDNFDDNLIQNDNDSNLNNMSLNCTARYEVNKVHKKTRLQSKETVKGGDNKNVEDLDTCVQSQESECSSSDDLQKRIYRKNVPDVSRIVEGKRKRERVGKVEEFLKSAFGKKRKKKEMDGDGSLDELTQPKSPTRAVTMEINTVNQIDNDTAVLSKNENSQKKPRGRPRKNRDKHAEIPDFIGNGEENLKVNNIKSSNDNSAVDTLGKELPAARKRGRPKLQKAVKELKEESKFKVVNHDTDDEQVVPECIVESENEKVTTNANKDMPSNSDNVATRVNILKEIITSNANAVIHVSDSENNTETNCVDSGQSSPQIQVKTLVDKNNVICTTEISVVNVPKNNIAQPNESSKVEDGIQNYIFPSAEKLNDYDVDQDDIERPSENDISNSNFLETVDGRSDVTNSTEKYCSSREISPEKDFKVVTADSNSKHYALFSENVQERLSSVDDDIDSVDGLDDDCKSSEDIAATESDIYSSTVDEEECQALTEKEKGQSNSRDHVQSGKPDDDNEISKRDDKHKVDKADAEKGNSSTDMIDSCGGESSQDENQQESYKSDGEDSFGLVLSPGERVKMNKRSCKKETDFYSPVWVRRTQKQQQKDVKTDSVVSIGNQKTNTCTSESNLPNKASGLKKKVKDNGKEESGKCDVKLNEKIRGKRKIGEMEVKEKLTKKIKI
ncbi:PRDM2-like protein [Mya arenaria]|uniref:PRDM2-like protein n=1 Tax=Mya arenaria TaxID=6604 RepID=A0ABY7FTP4_MYAAR|nr:PRDM2-like protein [Mya arenaria]